jgi:hypothetical protein
MRKTFYALLLLLFGATAFTQTLISPVGYSTVKNAQPTFKWNKIATAIYGYEIYVSANAGDASSLTIPNSADVGKYKRYFRTGATVNDTTATLDSVLAKNATTIYWKVRAKTSAGYGTWVYTSGAFSVGVPSASITDAGNATIVMNHDTLSAISRLTYIQGSNKQILDATYNDANNLGLGTTGTRDTLLSWVDKADTSVYTYRNFTKYGKTGSKILTIAHGATGVTVDMAITLENTKTVTLASAWKPGGNIGNDNVFFVKNAPSKVALTFPATAAGFGPDSMKLCAMYDPSYNEYFGFKSSAMIAVKDTQQTSLLKQMFTLNNTTGSTKTYTLSFAVKKSRLDYFDAWAANRTILVTKPATGDTLSSGNNYVVWESFGAKPDTIKYSLNGGTTFGSLAVISKDTVAIDSIQYSIPVSASFQNNCMLNVLSTKGDSAVTGIFNVTARYLTITTPAAAATIAPGDSYIVWSNHTGSTVNKVMLSLDSGKTYTGALTVSSSAVTDSVLYTFNGAKTTSTKCFVQAYTAALDTSTSGLFTISSGGAVFSMPPTFGDPASQVWVPVNFADGVAGDSLKAFDFAITYDSSYVKYDSIAYDAKLSGTKWYVSADTVFAAGANKSFVRVSGFKNTTGVGIKNSQLVSLRFSINNSQAHIGSTVGLTIKNGVLSAAGNNALSLNVSGSTDGTIKIYSSVAGNIHYMHGKWDGSPSYTISGDSLISYTDVNKPANFSVFNVSNGYYKMGSREPGDSIIVAPAASKYMSSGLASITTTDAQLAWRDWTDTLQVRQRVAADVNGDSLINTTDAMAIMEISVDSTYLSRVGLSSWIFVDSTSLAGFESRNDSLTAWYTQQQHSITSVLSVQQTKQDFFGVLRGDVDLSYGAAAISTMKKSAAAPVMFCTDEKVAARPGDTVWIPMTINLNGSNIGGFNTSMKLDPSVFTYTGQYKVGPTIPQGKNWYIAAKADANGVLRVAGTDFSLNINPITLDGPALLFKYVVNKETKRGTTTAISVSTEAVVDSKLQKVASTTKGGEVEISRMGASVVTDYSLAQNYPNPFNPSTTIEYALPKDSKVDIQIFNIIGQQVATLFSGVQTVGYHQVDFNASRVASGIYFYVIKASSLSGDQDFHAVKKMMLLK